jgi:hypothetical protein
MRDTCRQQIKDIKSIIGHGQDYGIVASGTVGNFSGAPGCKEDFRTCNGGGADPDTEITSGGPGSTGRDCCGISIGVHNRNGYIYAATEDWSGPSGKATYLCDDDPHSRAKPCTQKGVAAPGLGNGAYGQPLNLQWYVSHSSGHVY